jgi:hypothetical protein
MMGLRGLAALFVALLFSAGVACDTFSTPPSTAGADAATDATSVDATPLDAAALDGSAPDAPGVSSVGCADGTREAFESVAQYPNQAGCAGHWTKVGMGAPSSCAFAAGNDSAHSDGLGCAAADLCAAGWNVCDGMTDVTTCATSLGVAGFYATRQYSGGMATCGAAGNDDVFGCVVGGLTGVGVPTGCMSLNAVISTSSAPTGWSLGTADTEERANVANLVGAGGVMCCRK